MAKVLLPSFPRCSCCVFLAAPVGALGTVPTTLRGIFEADTPHMELENKLNVIGGARGHGIDITHWY